MNRIEGAAHDSEASFAAHNGIRVYRPNMNHPRIALSVYSFACAVVLILTGCNAQNSREEPAFSQRGMLLGDLEIRRGGGVLLRLEVEIAQTPEERTRGLMNVESLPENSGMVFLNGQLSKSPFWMKDTKFPLDIAFWDEQSTIVDTLTMQPCTGEPCPLYYPSAEYVSALEANRGVLASNDVKVGDRVLLRKRAATP